MQPECGHSTSLALPNGQLYCVGCGRIRTQLGQWVPVSTSIAGASASDHVQALIQQYRRQQECAGCGG
jgi:predicted Fe-S protein YdhL (DUF1289 family)